MDNINFFVAETIKKFHEAYEEYLIEAKERQEVDSKTILSAQHLLGERVLKGELKSAKEVDEIANQAASPSKSLKKKASTLEEFNDLEVLFYIHFFF